MIAKKLFIESGKGIVTGASMLIPGVSGGTMAIILGFYDKIISAVSSFFKDPKKNFITLLIYCGSAGLGILLFANMLLFVTNAFPMPMMYLFTGAVLGSIPMLYKKTELKVFPLFKAIFPLLGIVVVLLLDKLPTDLLSFNAKMGLTEYIILLVAGVIIAIALVLPGISVSYMLLVLGIYQPTLKAIEGMNLTFLIPLGLSVLLGVFLSTKLLEYTMKKYPDATFLTIIGFVVASIKDIFPGIPGGINIFFCLLTFAAGFIMILYISKFSD
jgi:putative membrane protein